MKKIKRLRFSVYGVVTKNTVRDGHVTFLPRDRMQMLGLCCHAVAGWLSLSCIVLKRLAIECNS